jgi:hypothetical protein
MKISITKIMVVASVCLAVMLPQAQRSRAADVYGATRRRQASEYEIKAVYLYNFLLFVEWPEPKALEEENGGSDKESNSSDKESNSEDGTIRIGILGRDPFGNAFDKVEGKLVKSRKKKLVIERFGPYTKKTKLGECQLLFICSSEKAKFDRIIKDIKGKPILTIADSSEFLEAGGMIKMVMVGKKIRWEINETPVAEAHLRLNAQLLRNAVRVVQIPKMPDKEDSPE